MFTDSTRLRLTAGKGGDGCLAWRKEKFIPKGGPDGGDGGRGGDIYLQADTQILSLEDYRKTRLIAAENGRSGGGKQASGRAGKDKTLKVPVGTIIKDISTKEVLFDLKEDGQKVCVCKGGKGGKGNYHFKTSTNRAPIQTTPGLPGEEKETEFELKLIADVGLVGMPNAGKSTLISQITKAKVKIAPYPFTTLRPNIGVLEFEDFTRIFIADIPGIIDLAHINKGLGHSFLRHIERTKLLVFVLDISEKDPFEDFKILKNELLQYNEDLLKKPIMIVLNKIDLPEMEIPIQEFRKKIGDTYLVIEISAMLSQNLDMLRKHLYLSMQEHFKSAFLAFATSL